MPTSYVTHADLECVDSQYLLCGQSDGGISIYDISTIKEGRVFNEVGSVKGGQRGSHKYQVCLTDIHCFRSDAKT